MFNGNDHGATPTQPKPEVNPKPAPAETPANPQPTHVEKTQEKR